MTDLSEGTDMINTFDAPQRREKMGKEGVLIRKWKGENYQD